MRTVLAALIVCLLCITLGSPILGFAGWKHGYGVSKLSTGLILILVAAVQLLDFHNKKSGEPLTPVKRTGRPQSLNFPAREFQFQNRGYLTTVLAVMGTVPLLAALGLAVAFITKRGNISAEFVLALSAVAVFLGSVCLWCAARVWDASVLLERDGVTVHMTYSRGRFGWDDLIAFERVQIADGNGQMHWWFRLVTAKRAYIFQDALEDRVWFVKTVTQASGLELVDAE